MAILQEGVDPGFWDVSDQNDEIHEPVGGVSVPYVFHNCVLQALISTLTPQVQVISSDNPHCKLSLSGGSATRQVVGKATQDSKLYDFSLWICHFLPLPLLQPKSTLLSWGRQLFSFRENSYHLSRLVHSVPAAQLDFRAQGRGPGQDVTQTPAQRQATHCIVFKFPSCVMLLFIYWIE